MIAIEINLYKKKTAQHCTAVLPERDCLGTALYTECLNYTVHLGIIL